MSVNGIQNNVAYGLRNPLQKLSPLAIIARRAPLSGDVGEVGQQWVYNGQIWEYSDLKTWVLFAVQTANLAAVSGAFAITNNLQSGTLTLTGNTLAQSATQVITFSNGYITTSNAVLLSVASTNVSGNAALLTVKGVVQSAGALAISVTNNGGASGLGATDTIIISFMVIG